MIPQEFEYSAPATMEEALALVQSGERKILAGGMSLIPMMKLRLATPAEVVDLRRITGLRGVSETGGVVRIGAMATHHDVESSPVTRGRCPLLAETAGYIGDVQVRNMGTIGGSIAHADPAADYPAALLALEARIHLVSASGTRTVDAADFFVDAFSTALEPGEIIHQVDVPVEEPSEGYRYAKVEHPASGFAVIGVAARVKKNGRTDCDGAGRRHRFWPARLPRFQCGAGARGRRGDRGCGEHHRRGRRGQLGPVRFRRIPAPPAARSRRTRDRNGAIEGDVKIAGEATVPAVRERAYNCFGTRRCSHAACPAASGWT